jgi:hypothetical protein
MSDQSQETSVPYSPEAAAVAALANPKPPGVVRQVRIALARKPCLAATLGAILGGSIPAVTYTLAHHEWSSWASVLTILIAGGLVFSMVNRMNTRRNEWRARAEKAEATVNAIHTAQRYSPIIVLDDDIPIVSCEPDPLGKWLRRSDLLFDDE